MVSQIQHLLFFLLGGGVSIAVVGGGGGGGGHWDLNVYMYDAILAYNTARISLLFNPLPTTGNSLKKQKSIYIYVQIINAWYKPPV